MMSKMDLLLSAFCGMKALLGLVLDYDLAANWV